jgi:hypothetical protein
MKIENIYSAMNNSCFRLISPEISVKDEFIKRRIKQYSDFKGLLEYNRTIKEGHSQKRPAISKDTRRA